MIYPADFEDRIGFAPLRLWLKERCKSEYGRHKVDKMEFSTDYSIIANMLGQTEEMRKAVQSGSDLPSAEIHWLTPRLEELRASGSWLTSNELLRLQSLLNSVSSIKKFFVSYKTEEDKPVYPLLSKEFQSIADFPLLVKEIDSVINKFGEVKDSASPQLMELRRAVQSAKAAMTGVVHRIIDRAVAKGELPKDTSPSIRDGRLVIPVAAGDKRLIEGIIHDESATGKTVFVEPVEVVRASNQLRELQLEEQREVNRILLRTSDTIRPYIEEINGAAESAGVYDFIKSKAELAVVYGGQYPNLSSNPVVEWFHAEHPVLKMSLESQGRKVVPLDITLGNKTRILIISGPNAGGKSVCLKTVGTIQYMAQCGMLPPVYSNSRMGLFRKIFVDIGDSQSLENDLSTYSSHLRNMKHFLRYADKRTLILADEMGSGTEPQIGGAIAQSILQALGEVKAYGVVTTHYQNLKTFAEQTEGFVNGAMLYDRARLQPLFQLAIGNPGSSFALEIAAKIGLRPDVVSRAKELVGAEYVNMDKYLLEIARDRKYWSDKRRQIKDKEGRLDQIMTQYESKAEDLRAQRNEIIREAKRHAKEIMSGANAKLEKAIRDIREVDAEKERTKSIRRELEQYKRSLDKDNEVSEEPQILRKSRRKSSWTVADKPHTNADIKFEAGDYVRMSEGGVIGQILAIEGKKAHVAFGSLKMTVEINKLQAAAKPRTSALDQQFAISQSTSDDSRRRQLNFKREIDIRGMRADEALQAVTYFIDDALQFQADRVRILHGTGHGILRTLIRQLLSTMPGVKRYHDEDVRFGGAGITVVEFD